MKERNIVLDIAKGLGIILIVFSHLTTQGQLQRNFVHLFNVPIFFIISGYLYKERKIEENLKKGLKGYIIPAYIFLGLDILKGIVQNRSLHIWGDFDEFFKTITFTGGIWSNYPIWFLPTLFCVNQIFNILKDDKCKINIAVLCVIINCFFKIKFNGYLWPMCVLYGLPFYIIGYFLNRIDINDIRFVRIIVDIIIIGIFGGLNFYNSMIEQYFEYSYLIFFITGLFGTDLIYCLSIFIAKLKIKDLFIIIGRKSLFIMLTHYYICRWFIPMTLKKLNMDYLYNNICIQLVFTIILILCYYMFFKIYKKIKREDGILL